MPRHPFPKKDRELCVECQWNPPKYRYGPTGNLIGDDFGICVECLERLIRRPNYIKNPRMNLNLKLENEIVAFF